MLKETMALNFWPDKYRSIDDTLEIYRTQFCEHLLRLYHQFKVWENDRPIETGLVNYARFRDTFPNAKPITYNSKNLVFETHTNLWEKFEFFIERLRENGVNPDMTKNPKHPMLVSNVFESIGDRNNVICDLDSISLFSNDEYRDFFGRGEFPIIVMSIVRIGNQEYSFWDISR